MSKTSRKCEVEGCERKAETKKYGNLCSMHFKRFYRYGTTKLPVKQKQNTCKYCDRKIGNNGSFGMCHSHYRSFKLYGDPHAVEKRKKQPGSRGYMPRRNGKDEHQIIMEGKIERKLKRGEIVHHINLDKLDNREENLHLCKGASEHSILHRKLEKCAAELFKLGYIKFENGEYIIN